MATPGIRQRRMKILSAPPMSRLPRLDSCQVRKELTQPERRQGTAKIRRNFLESRRDDFVEETTKKEEIERLKKYKKYLDNMKLLCRSNKDTDVKGKDQENSVWQKEVTKIDLPERLPITVPMRLKSAQQTLPRHEHLFNTTPMFYRVRFSTSKEDSSICTDGSRSAIKQKLQYFINQDWSSEKVSWFNLHKNVPEYQKANWIC
ncbi:uncharacterized protein LOC123565877 [Mercenaria mercenaria]|uniref:uncharacterized protein LOC123565877 n=1 Tax=Mercenaria mercenaria TaxID=6596 RepID=UPI00234F7C7F|nr:uncharacterized protein LOC123565877 [Mercenaria mercenaria]